MTKRFLSELNLTTAQEFLSTFSNGMYEWVYQPIAAIGLKIKDRLTTINCGNTSKRQTFWECWCQSDEIYFNVT